MRTVWAVFLCVICCSANSPLESRLDRQLKIWQKRLGLENWNLTLRVVRQAEIDQNSWGASEWDPDSRTGTVSVLDPRDYNLRGGDLKLDMECTIVHELVHIQVSPLDSGNPEAHEEVVNRIMTALLNRQCPN